MGLLTPTVVLIFLVLLTCLIALHLWEKARPPEPAPRRGMPPSADPAPGGRESRFTQSDRGAGSTRFELRLKAPSPGTFHLRPERPADFRLRLRLPEAVSVELGIGPTAASQRYLIRASPPGFVRQLFAVERRVELVTRIAEIARIAPPIIDLSRHALVVEWGWRITAPDALEVLRRAALALVEAVERIPSLTPGIVFLPDDAPVGECQVCGGRMEDEIVHCRRCRTPHHRECWSYNGRCSTFACREVRHDGAPGSPAGPLAEAPDVDAADHVADCFHDVLRAHRVRSRDAEFHAAYRERWRLPDENA